MREPIKSSQDFFLTKTTLETDYSLTDHRTSLLKEETETDIRSGSKDSLIVLNSSSLRRSTSMSTPHQTLSTYHFQPREFSVSDLYENRKAQDPRNT